MKKPSSTFARMSLLSRSLLWAAALISLGLLALPLIALAWRGLTSDGWVNLPETGILDAVRLSLLTTLQTVIITVLFGTPLAYVLARFEFPLKRFANLLVELPIVLPPAVAGLALLVTFGRRGLLGGILLALDISLPFTRTAVVIAQTFVAAPFYIRSAVIGFQTIPDELEDAAQVDGASEIRVFWHITLPIARRALAAGLILSWARALGEFGATILFAGSLRGETQTMPLLVYNILERDIEAAIITGLLLIAIAIIALTTAQWLTRSAT